MKLPLHSILAFGIITIGCGMLMGLGYCRIAIGFFVTWGLAKIIEST